jgi:hypothetical protein
MNGALKEVETYLSESLVKGHCRMTGILGQVQVRGTAELLLNHQSLMKKK